MATAAYAIPTLTEVKNYLKINDTTIDSILEGWIDRASYAIETYCSRKFAIQGISNEIHDGNGSDILYTKYSPITQLSTETTPTDPQKLAAVQYRTSPDNAWTDIETDVDHIFLEDDWPYIKLYDKTFPVGERNIKVSYKAGYSIIPGKIWQVAVEMIAMTWKRSNQSGLAQLGKSSNTNSAAGTTFTTGLLDMNPQWKEALDYWKVRKRSIQQTMMVR